MTIDVAYIVAAFLVGYLLNVVIGVFRKGRKGNDEIIIDDCGYDPRNPMNQKRREWKPFEVDGITLYKLQ